MFQQGQQIGLYTLIERIGKGSFGEVWTAEKRTQFVTKKVAVKLPHDETLDFEAIRQEATLWEEASGHPNVLPIIDADIYDGQVAIVSEYASGGSLSNRLKIEEKLPVKEAVEMTIGILNGLEYLHSKKIIHRDIKPANILLQGDMPRLADFGISRAIETSTISSVVVGTESYMSPEAFDGKRNQQTDIWSVGVVLYQLLSGRLPFPQKRASEVMYAVLLKEPEPLPEDVPPKLQEIILKALEKDQIPEESPKRYQTASEMRDDLRNFLITFSQVTHSTNKTSPENQLEIKPNLPETAPVQVKELAPTVAQTVQIETPTLVKDKETSKEQSSPATFGQILTKKEVLPFVVIAVIIVFFGIGSLLVRTESPTAATNSNVVIEQTNTSSNSAVNTSVSSTTNSNSLPNAAQQQVNEAYKFYQDKKYNKAIEAYTKAIELAPNDYALYNDRGLIYHAERNYDKAIADFDKSIELNPTSLTYNNRGVAYQDKGNREKAIADYNKALELDPTNEQASKNLAEVLK